MNPLIIATCTALQVMHAAPASTPTGTIPPSPVASAQGNSAVLSAYGIEPIANAASKVELSVSNAELHAAMALADDGTKGFSVDVGVRIPLVNKQGTSKDLRKHTGLSFEYRNDMTIPAGITVAFGSENYPSQYVKAHTVYGGWIFKSSDLAGGSVWKTAVIDFADLALPAWWAQPIGYPSIDSVFKAITDVEILPMTTFNGMGTENGNACFKCTDPTLKSLHLDIRNLQLVTDPSKPMITPPGPIIPPGPKNPPPTSTQLSGGLELFSNPSSSIAASIASGVIHSDIKFKSEGTEGYSANVAIRLALDSGRAAVDLSDLDSMTFEFRNAEQISDRLSVSVLAANYPAGLIDQGITYSWEVTGSAQLAGSALWKSATFLAMDLATPAWWTMPVTYPSVKTILANADRIEFRPQTRYLNDGSQNGMPCRQCVGPISPALTLEIRDIRMHNRKSSLALNLVDQSPISNLTSPEFAGVANRSTSERAISWHGGALHLASPDQWKSVEIVSLSGVRKTSLAPAAQMPTELPNGSYFAILHGRTGERSVFSLQVVR